MTATYTKAQNIIDLFDGGCEEQARKLCNAESIAIESDWEIDETIFEFADGSKVLAHGMKLNIA